VRGGFRHFHEPTGIAFELCNAVLVVLELIIVLTLHSFS
jgi:hypothetical protein